MTKSNEAIKKAVSEILTNRKITRRVHSVQISDLYQEINLRDVDVQYFSEEITAKVIEPLIQKLQDKFMEISFKQIYGNEKTDEHTIDESFSFPDNITLPLEKRGTDFKEEYHRYKSSTPNFDMPPINTIP